MGGRNKADVTSAKDENNMIETHHCYNTRDPERLAKGNRVETEYNREYYASHVSETADKPTHEAVGVYKQMSLTSRVCGRRQPTGVAVRDEGKVGPVRSLVENSDDNVEADDCANCVEAVSARLRTVEQIGELLGWDMESI
jgi:hypothetical protein